MAINVPVLMFMILAGCKHLRLRTRRGRRQKGRTAEGHLSARRRLKRDGNYCRRYLLWATEANVADYYFTAAAVCSRENPAARRKHVSELAFVPASKDGASGAGGASSAGR